MTALRRPLFAFAALAVAFVLVSAAVATNLLRGADVTVQDLVLQVQTADGIRVARGLAVLGGLEVTGALAVATFLWMRRERLVPECWAMLVFPIVVAVEVVYKRIVDHPPPPHALKDGPTLLELLSPLNAAANGAGSFPSGHMTRAVVVYGILAFIVTRFSTRRWVRVAAVASATAICVAVAVTRLYLDVHWESDVLGGILLGGLGLVAAIIWLDRPL